MKCIFKYLILIGGILCLPSCEMFMEFPENEGFKIAPVETVKPADGAWVQLGSNYFSYQFIWNASEYPNAVYEVLFGESANNLVSISSTENTSEYILIEKNKTYYWRIKTIVDGVSVESPVWSFSTL